MNILQVIPYFVPAWGFGGPVSVSYNISKELVKRGHRVTVFTTDALNPEKRIRESEETVDGIDVIRFRNWSNFIAAEHRIFLAPGIISALRRRLKSYDVIHIHEYRVLFNIIVHHYALKYRVPYVIQSHGALPRIMAKQKLKRLYDVIWGNTILKDAAGVIAATPLEAEQYPDTLVKKSKIITIPNGIDLTDFADLPGKGAFRQKHGLSRDMKVVLYLGRIDKIKGLDLLVRAFYDLYRETHDARLVMAGIDDGYLPELKKMVQELKIEAQVLFPGPLYGRDKLEAYVDADVYVLPSNYEIFGLTILESLACGTPVVITDRCGLAGTVAEQAGLVVPYDQESLRTAISRILNDSELRRRLSDNGKLLVQAQFDWKNIVGRVEQLYKEVQR